MKQRWTAYQPGIPGSEEENRRLSELQRYQVIDDSPNLELDRIAEASAILCKTPYAFVNFIEEDRQLAKASYGLGKGEFQGREFSLCHFTLQSQEGFLEIPDIQESEEFADHPFTDKFSHIRYYAGVPIQVDEGSRIGVLCVMDEVPGRIGEKEKKVMLALAEQVQVSLKLHLLNRRLKDRHREELSRAMVDTEIQERQRIGEEIHDGVVQSLAAASMYMNLIRGEQEKGKGVELPYFDELDSLVEQATRELRGIGHSLMGKEIGEKGLKQAIEDLAEKYGPIPEAPEIRTSLQYEGGLESNEEITFYRIVQEFVNNSVKHANADLIRIGIQEKSGKLIMELSDDGIGFQQEEENPKSGGLANMEKRVRSLGGDYRFNTIPGKGAELRVELNLNR